MNDDAKKAAQTKLEASLGNAGKLTKKWLLPGEDRHTLAHDYNVPIPSIVVGIHFDPHSMQVYTRVPYEEDGELLVAPASKEGKADLLAQGKVIAAGILSTARAEFDDGKSWSRVIRVHYARAEEHTPDWCNGAGRKRDTTGSRRRSWEFPGFYEFRETRRMRKVHVDVARRLGHEVTREQAAHSSTVSIPVDDPTGTGSDVVGPLLISRVEISSDPGWAEALMETSSEAHSRRQGRTFGGPENPHYRKPMPDPQLHVREWEEDWLVRVARWEADSSRSQADLKAKPKRWRKTETASFWGVKQFPWSNETWADLQHFQETIRTVDRRLRKFMQSKDDEFLALLSGGRLLGAPREK